MRTPSKSALCQSMRALCVGKVFAAGLLLSLAGGLGVAQNPVVVSSSLVSVPHNEHYGAPWQNAVNNRGDFALLDFKTGGLYIYPGTGAAEVSFAPNVLAGGFTDSGIAIDPRNNNLYIDDNYNNGLLKLAWDAASQSYDIPATQVATSLSGNLGGSCGNYFQSVGLAINDNGLMAVATENGCGVEIFTVQINADGTFGAASPVVSNLTKRAKTVALDDAGNIYFTEDSGGPNGVLYYPAGTTGMSSDATAMRIDPNLGNIQGVSVDKAGNIYAADGTAGVYLIPLLAGVPNTAGAILLTTAPAQSNASLDQRHGILFVPISSYNGFNDVVNVYLNRLELGSVAAGATSASPGTVYYAFSGAATPAGFSIAESGSSNADFSVATGGTCAAGTAYGVGSTCTVNVSFTPHLAGDISATLLMLDAQGKVLSRTLLHGVASSAQGLLLPSMETVLGSGLQSPQQIAADAAGNVFVADRSLGKVLEFPAGSTASTVGTSVGSGLVAPTGIAVSRAGSVYIADSGTVYRIPYGPSGLNASAQTVLRSGLGSNLQLALDGLGNLFVADPMNQRVVELSPLVLGTAELDIPNFNALNAIAADGSGNVYVANGSNLVQVSPQGVQKTLLTMLPAANGLAVDASGSLYVTTANSAIRIPSESGMLTPADQVVIGESVAAPMSIALDAAGNAYIANGSAGNVDAISLNGMLNLGTLTSTTGSSTGSVTLVNDGNGPLTVTSFSSTPDFSVTSTTCTSAPIAVGATCSTTVTFMPGPGDQGTLRGQLTVNGNQDNGSLSVSAIGVGATLSNSKTALTVTKPTVTSNTAVVVVSPVSGTTPVPTGNVTLTVTGTAGSQPYTFNGVLVNGSITFNATAIPVGSYTYTAVYQGDRVYGSSTASTAATVGVGAVKIIQPAASTVPVYVLSTNQGAQPPFDGSQLPYLYKYPLQVVGADGNPLLGVPEFKNGSLSGYDYGEVTYTVSSGSPACSGTSATVNVDNTGAARLDTSCLQIDTSNNQIVNLATSYTITPVYDGKDSNGTTNPNYATASGAPFTVVALRNPVVTITSNPSTLSVAAGSSSTATLTLTSLLGYGVLGAQGQYNNYSLPLELECANLPAHATCTFSYPKPNASDAQSVDVVPGAPGTVLMTLNTSVAVGTTASIGTTPGTVLAGFGLTGVLSLLIGRRRLGRVRLLSVLISLLLMGGVAGMTSCSSKGNISTPNLATPAGSYNVTVTAKQTGSKQVPGANPGTTITVYGNNNQMSLPFAMNVTVH